LRTKTTSGFCNLPVVTDRKWNRPPVLPLRWRTRVETVRLLVVGALALVSLFALAPGSLLVMKAR
jgi:hypothetical protein